MDRTAPPQTADERGTLVGLLDFLRATVMLKMDGVADDDARRATVAASTMTPMGTVKHLTAVERWWFSVDFAGHDVEWPWPDGRPAATAVISTSCARASTGPGASNHP